MADSAARLVWERAEMTALLDHALAQSAYLDALMAELTATVAEASHSREERAARRDALTMVLGEVLVGRDGVARTR